MPLRPVLPLSVPVRSCQGVSDQVSACAAAEADAQASMEEDQVLMTIQEKEDDHETKATRIFNCLMELDEKVRQEEISEFPSSNSTPSTQE